MRAQNARARRLDGEGHIRVRCRHAQRLKQRNQAGVSALVEHQKAGIDAVCHHLAAGIGQADINGVGVAAKIVTGFKQRHARLSAQAVRRRQTRYA